MLGKDSQISYKTQVIIWFIDQSVILTDKKEGSVLQNPLI